MCHRDVRGRIDDCDAGRVPLLRRACRGEQAQELLAANANQVCSLHWDHRHGPCVDADFAGVCRRATPSERAVLRKSRELLVGTQTHEARSRLRWHSDETLEGWDHATTVAAVDTLYSLGAQRVYYHPVILIVVLPKEADERTRIFQWEFANVKKKQGQPTPDEQQWYMMIAPPH